jgi:FkbM family methyltransferase
MFNYELMQPKRMVLKQISERNFNFVKNCLPLIKKKEVKIIFDVGANAGTFSASFCELFIDAHIYSFEPVYKNYIYLIENIDKLGLTNRVSCFNIGFWKYPCTKSLGMPVKKRNDPDNIGLYSIYGTDNVVEAKFDSMNNWCNTHNIWPDIMKMDCEGSEPKILKGATQVLDKVKYMIIEHSKNDGISKIINKDFTLSDKPVEKGGNRFWVKNRS